MDLTILYRYGYDFASRYADPMANDGQQDFYTITHLEPNPQKEADKQQRPISLFSNDVKDRDSLPKP